MSRDLIKHVDTWGKNIPEEGTANAGALSILEFTWLVGGIARRPAWPELRMQELRLTDVCVDGGLQASEGTLAFTLGEVAAHTWGALNRGVT